MHSEYRGIGQKKKKNKRIMASTHNTQDQQNGIDQLNDRLTSVGQHVERNKKYIFWACGAILAIGAFVIGYLFIYKNPRENKSFEEYASVELKAMGNDSLATAEYMRVAKKYSSFGGGNLAALNAGELLYGQGNYKEAAKYLEMFSTSETVMQANVYRLIGDCYVNLDNYKEALKYFDKAISRADGNPQITPGVLMKKAAVYDEQKEYGKALECYEAIESEFPTFTFGLPIDAYIAREKARLGK